MNVQIIPEERDTLLLEKALKDPTEENIKASFLKYDTFQDHMFSKREFRNVLLDLFKIKAKKVGASIDILFVHKTLSSMLLSVFSQADKNKDKSIDYSEYKQYILEESNKLK